MKQTDVEFKERTLGKHVENIVTVYWNEKKEKKNKCIGIKGPRRECKNSKICKHQFITWGQETKQTAKRTRQT